MVGTLIRRVIPYVNFFVASSALCFQFFVLYPWHLELDNDFRKMQEDQHVTLEEYHQKKIKRLEEIEKNILRLEAFHHRNDEPKQK
jgi:transcription termination factor NusB